MARNQLFLFGFIFFAIVFGGPCTPCGYSPLETNTSCCNECFFFDTKINACVPSCGNPCKTDDDCGSVPDADCTACNHGFCDGNADFGNCAQQNAWNGGRKAPVLPHAWQAKFNFTNFTDGTTAQGQIWYDDRFGGLRTDFYPTCPFAELQAADNNVPCSVLFYKGYNYYVYPKSQMCCGYHFPVWKADSYQVGNASFGGQFNINGVPADYWRLCYTCAWTRPPTPITRNRLPALTVQRDIYLRAGTNIPLRMNETLTSGYSDFYDLQLGPIDESIFKELTHDCEMARPGPDFLKVCRKYNAHGLTGYLGYD